MTAKARAFIFVLLLLSAGGLVAACGGSSQTVDGDSDGDVSPADGDVDGEEAIDPELARCYSFCERSYECDQSGTFGDGERLDCRELCPNIGQTCVTRQLLECAEQARCDLFISCVLANETASDCVFPIDGDEDDDDTGYRADISVPDELNFGAVVLGQSVQRKLTITNGGQIVLEIYDLIVSDNLTEFSLNFDNESALIIPPGDSADIPIVYSPQDAGKDSATLLIYSNDPISRVTRVNLVSEYKGYANVGVAVETLEFGTVAVGGTSVPRVLRISNTPGSPTDNRLLTINDLVIVNDSEGGFQFDPESPAPPFYVIPNSHVDIQLLFTPPTWGEITDTLQIVSDSNEEADRLLEVGLLGTGAARRLCVNPDPIQFGSVKVGQSGSRQIELESCGSSTVSVQALTLSDEDSPFDLQNLPPLDGVTLDLEVGERATFTVTFSPETTIGQSTTLIVTSNDLAFPVREVQINGQGSVSNLTPSPQVLAFDNVGVGGSKTLPMSLRNIGTWPVTVTGVRFDLESSPFSVVDADFLFPLELAGGEQQDLDILFNPPTEGSAYDNVTFESDNSGGEISVGLSGRGTSATLQLTPEADVVFESVQLGTTREATITVANTGRAPLTLSDWGLSLGESVFSVSPEATQTVLPYNASIDLIITYEPQVVGSTAGLFYIDSDDTDLTRRHVELNLSGEAIDPILTLEQTFPYDFGQVFVGAQGGPLAVTIRNTGVGPLLVKSIKHNELFTEAFNLIITEANFPVLLRPDDASDDHFTFFVTFVPETASNYSGVIEIDSNDPDRDPLLLSVSGRGALCPPNFYNCDDDPSNCEYECHGTPGSVELCNNVDDNCDCETDEGFAVGDLCAGEGVCPNGVTECDMQNPGEVICSTNPGGSDYNGTGELCNNLDDNCDGFTDETFGVGQACDGEGECGVGVLECKNAFSTRCSTERGGSADMTADEICDGRDNDCDSQTDEDFSVGLSCSGVGLCIDGVWECDGPDDVTCSSNPGGSEYPDPAPAEICDSQDNDCDGRTDENWNVGAQCVGDGECGVGFWECASGSTRRCSTNPGGSEYPSPAPQELCDGRDNDCDLQTDEDYQIDQACDGVGECGAGVWECRSLYSRRCSSDIGGTDYPNPAPIERCDGLDNDCDGLTDENFALDVACEGVGQCGQGVFECDGLFSTRCSTDFGGSAYEGSDEVCDGQDNDCDGITDELFAVGSLCEGVGQCGTGVIECDPNDSSRTICSSDPDGSNPQDQEELCDGRDNDCDGITDNLCRSNVYRFTLDGGSGDDDYRLDTQSAPPNGFVAYPAGPVFAVYDVQLSGTVALVQLTNAAATDTVYLTDPAEITQFEGQGYTNDGILGYVSASESEDAIYPLYRLANAGVSAHIYTADYDEFLLLLGEGWDPQGVEGYVWAVMP